MKDIDILVGSTIQSIRDNGEQSLFLQCDTGLYEIVLGDDGCGGNDSHAFFDGSTLDTIVGHKITEAHHEDRDSYGVKLIVTTADKTATLTITHEHNGYYGFSYEIIKRS